jgi:gamma-glutamyltranspeptidase/glutathione hydrolase
MSAPKGAVAAGHQLTAEAATAILEKGGNAFDACLAAAWTACVCEPVLASPGGGGFAMLRKADGATNLIDFFAQTPRHKSVNATDCREIHADFGTATQAFHIGSAATATPGFVPGLFHLHETHASLPMATLLAPAIAQAEVGVIVTSYQHLLSEIISPILMASPQARDLFAPHGEMIRPGERFHNPGLTSFLQSLASTGLAAYDTITVPLILQCLGDGGHLTLDDFTSYRVEEREPLTLDLAGARTSLNPLPSAGGTLIAHTLSSMPDLTPLSLARALDATDNARRDRNSTLARTLANAAPSYRGTTHISVVDATGNACAMTISNGEGNGDIVEGNGFMPNNMLGESDVNPHGALGWQEDCRLSSMMCPTIMDLADGGLIALGSGGSNRIRSAIATVLCQLAGDCDGLAQAVDAPRMHVEHGHLDVEAQFAEADLLQLKNAFRDHRVWHTPNMFFGGCHAAARTTRGKLFGAGDARRQGVALVV